MAQSDPYQEAALENDLQIDIAVKHVKSSGIDFFSVLIARLQHQINGMLR